jgi:hypothetical protein
MEGELMRYLLLLLLPVIASAQMSISSPFYQAAFLKPAEGGGGGGNTLVKSEDFSSAAAGNNPLTDISGWAARDGVVRTTDARSKDAYGGTIANYSCAYWSSGTASLNQRVEFTISAMTAGFYVGGAVRVQAGSVDYYMVLVSNGEWLLQKCISGLESTIANANPGWTVGTKVALEVTGSGASTRLKVQADTGSGWTDVQADINPSDYLGAGHAGIAAYDSNANAAIEDWKWYDLP